MTNYESLVKKFLKEAPKNPQRQFYRYYLQEQQPGSNRKYVSEAVVGLAPVDHGLQIFAFQYPNADGSKPTASHEQYYEALLQAQIPKRAHDNEALYNPPLDSAGVLLEAELQTALGIAQMMEYPLVATILYKPEVGTKLLAQFFSLLPFRPSQGLPLLQAAIRQRLNPR
jgi:hypothetical protein